MLATAPLAAPGVGTSRRAAPRQRMFPPAAEVTPGSRLTFDLPASVPVAYPRGRRALWGCASALDSLQIRPRPREPDAVWRPSWRCGDLPMLRDQWDFDRWLVAMWPGAVACYWLGLLARDRADNSALDLLARAILLRSATTLIRMTACGHPRGLWHGSGDVLPVCQLHGPAEMIYYVIRTTPRTRLMA